MEQQTIFHSFRPYTSISIFELIFLLPYKFFKNLV